MCLSTVQISNASQKLKESNQKFAEIFAAQGAPPVSLTPVANGKNLQTEKF